MYTPTTEFLYFCTYIYLLYLDCKINVILFSEYYEPRWKEKEI